MTQIWLVTRHQYGIYADVPQTSFGGKTSGDVAKYTLFSLAKVKRAVERRSAHFCPGLSCKLR